MGIFLLIVFILALIFSIGYYNQAKEQNNIDGKILWSLCIVGNAFNIAWSILLTVEPITK